MYSDMLYNVTNHTSVRLCISTPQATAAPLPLNACTSHRRDEARLFANDRAWRGRPFQVHQRADFNQLVSRIASRVTRTWTELSECDRCA